MAIKTKTAPLDPKIADRLLDLLSTDDLFRERFQRDHLAALRAIGYEAPIPGEMTACGTTMQAQPEPFADCKVEALASKDAIRQARLEIMAMLTHGLNQNTPQLDAGVSQERLVRK